MTLPPGGATAHLLSRTHSRLELEVEEVSRIGRTATVPAPQHHYEDETVVDSPPKNDVLRGQPADDVSAALEPDVVDDEHQHDR